MQDFKLMNPTASINETSLTLRLSESSEKIIGLIKDRKNETRDIAVKAFITNILDQLIEGKYFSQIFYSYYCLLLLSIFMSSSFLKTS